METDYTGMVTACYINMSKKNKEYSVGYINLADETGNITSYKFVIFKTDLVNYIKEFGPTNIKDKEITLTGVFSQNNYNGNSEYQLMVSDINLDSRLLGISGNSDLDQPVTTIPQPGIPQPVIPQPVIPQPVIPQPVSGIVMPTIPTV